ncbi:MAG: hypothetical protein JSU87_00645 [Gemmatimonadota bacterium]|nr:MAG: hypothetical protein JSU87_00645 [Gemmatimonadota bacterium]
MNVRRLLIVPLAALCLASDCHWQLSINDPEGVSTLVIRTVTTGTALDADGYTLRLTRGDDQELGIRLMRANDEQALQLSGVTGAHTVTLSDLSAHCAVRGENPRIVELVAGSTTEATFQIDCRLTPP